jgi:hypothetical protein
MIEGIDKLLQFNGVLTAAPQDYSPSSSSLGEKSWGASALFTVIKNRSRQGLTGAANPNFGMPVGKPTPQGRLQGRQPSGQVASADVNINARSYPAPNPTQRKPRYLPTYESRREEGPLTSEGGRLYIVRAR